MEMVKVKVSYRDKEKNENVPLGDVDVPRFANTAEAVAYFGEHDVNGMKGEEAALDLIHRSYDIILQADARAERRPDQVKTVSNVKKFKQLTEAQQEELLKQYLNQ